ncbi:MAG: VWA domain-containing protein, partial [Terriglobales bacterium]
PSATPPAPHPATPAAAATGIQIAPESPGHSQYADRRLVAIYFDLTTMQLADQLRAFAAASDFIAKDLKPADEVAVMDYSGNGVIVRQDFTANRDTLAAAIDKLTLGAGFGLDENGNDAADEDTGSAFGQDSAEFNIFNTNRQLAALHTAIDMLAPLSEKKSLVYFGSGLSLNGVDNQAQLEATTNAAIRDNVALYPIDARGLTASPPLGDATQGSPGGAAMYNGAAAAAFSSRLVHSQDSLYALGSDTGGKALLDTNNLEHGIALARDAITSYYLVGYYTSNGALDGKYRHVEVRLAAATAARLSRTKLAFRRGYYAGKIFAKFTTADKERQLEDALMLGDPITDLTIALEVNYFQLNSADYFVPIAAKIPGRELALAKKGGASQSQIDFIGEIKDNYGTTIANLRDQVKLKLSGETAAQLAKSPIEFTAGFTLLPGEYSLKLLARDDETGRIGTFILPFTIPNLMHATDRVPISSVVLSNQRVPLAAALFNASKNQGKSAAQQDNPLVSAAGELMPSVNHVFHRSDSLYILLQAYEHPADVPNQASGAKAKAAAAAAPQTVVAYASFYRDGRKVFETAPVRTTAPPAGRAGTLPIALTVPLARFQPGRYTVQVSVLEPGAGKANFWRAPIAIQP